MLIGESDYFNYIGKNFGEYFMENKLIYLKRFKTFFLPRSGLIVLAYSSETISILTFFIFIELIK